MDACLNKFFHYNAIEMPMNFSLSRVSLLLTNLNTLIYYYFLEALLYNILLFSTALVSGFNAAFPTNCL